MEELTTDDIASMLRTLAETIVANEVAFCELDSVAGDGDFGMSLATGFRVVLAEWESLPREDIGALLKGAAMIILEKCGGASGPIWGSALSAAARAAKGKTKVGLAEFSDMAAAAVAAIQKKGGAKRGDKTLLDAFIPAQEALAAATAAGRGIPDALAAAASAAVAGAEETKSMVASRGRASYVGERSLGHPDAGAFALGVLFVEVVDKMKERKGA